MALAAINVKPLAKRKNQRAKRKYPKKHNKQAPAQLKINTSSPAFTPQPIKAKCTATVPADRQTTLRSSGSVPSFLLLAKRLQVLLKSVNIRSHRYNTQLVSNVSFTYFCSKPT